MVMRSKEVNRVIGNSGTPGNDCFTSVVLWTSDSSRPIARIYLQDRFSIFIGVLSGNEYSEREFENREWEINIVEKFLSSISRFVFVYKFILLLNTVFVIIPVL